MAIIAAAADPMIVRRVAFMVIPLVPAPLRGDDFWTGATVGLVEALAAITRGAIRKVFNYKRTAIVIICRGSAVVVVGRVTHFTESAADRAGSAV
ncbi:MAG TPA: hypothetical protein VKI44_07060 [Acetobacteraceae bacterium]|nr:hypothetical protein [Acetobacteraceae bacterium]